MTAAQAKQIIGMGRLSRYDGLPSDKYAETSNIVMFNEDKSSRDARIVFASSSSTSSASAATLTTTRLKHNACSAMIRSVSRIRSNALVVVWSTSRYSREGCRVPRSEASIPRSNPRERCEGMYERVWREVRSDSSSWFCACRWSGTISGVVGCWERVAHSLKSRSAGSVSTAMMGVQSFVGWFGRKSLAGCCSARCRTRRSPFERGAVLGIVLALLFVACMHDNQSGVAGD